MQRSPKACSPTDRRIDYLAKAKLDRTQKLSDKKRIGGGSIRGSTVHVKNLAETNEWASSSSIGNLRNASNDSAFKKRNMTFDAGRDPKIDRKLMGVGSPARNAILRLDQSPIAIMKQIPGNNGKNDSDFTNCLLAGSHSAT